MNKETTKQLQQLEESESRYRNLFENSEISIWNEDFSNVYQTLEQLRQEGVTDLRSYLSENHQLAWDIASSVIVLEVNPATLKLFGANSSDEFIPQIDKTFGDGAIDVFIDGLCAYWENKRVFRAEANFHTLDGKNISAIISYHIPASAEGYKNVSVSIHDITERKLAENALLINEQKYRTLYENSPLAFQSLDEDGNFIDVNPAWLNTLGYNLDEVIGKNYGTFLHPDWKKHFDKNFPEFKRIGHINNVHFRIRHKDGHYLDIEFDGCIGHTPDGKFKQTYCVFQDITKRKQAEDALRESETHMRTLVETLPDLIWLKDPEGVYLNCNSKFEQFFGAKQSEIIGKTDHDFVSKELADFFREKDRAVVTAGTSLANEEEVSFASDGHVEQLETIKTPMFDVEGKLIGVLGVGRDITERKQAETELQEQKQSYEDLLDFTAEAIFGVNLHGECTFANPSCLKMLGYQDGKQLIGKNIHQLIHHTRADGSTCKSEDCPMHFTLRSGIEAHNDSELLWRADNSTFPAEYWSHPIRRDGEVVGAVVSFLDITERRQTEQALRRSQKLDAVGQLTGGIAHDFNNIINIIQGNLDLLERQTPDNESMQKRIKNIGKSTQRAAELTRQLLGFSRRQPELVEETNIRSIIHEMESLITRSVTPQVEIEYRLSPDLWETEIDPGDFEDSLLNLVLNARDAMHGKGRLIIETRNCTLDSDYCTQNSSATPGDYVELSISDSGTGITPEQLEHIFEPFFTTKDQGKGTGLGLSMVYGFIQRSNGHIKVDSEQRAGTTFRLYLPRSKQTSATPKTHTQHIETPSEGSGTILVVDDEEALLDLARESLQELGYHVLTAGNGAEALKILSKTPKVDLLVSDIIMPGGLNGYELAEQAILSHPQLKVMFVSGYKDSAQTKGDDTFKAFLLKKPYNLTELAQQVQTVLATK